MPGEPTSDFQSLIERAMRRGRGTVAIAVAQDFDAIEAAREAARLGLARSILVGDRRRIEAAAGSFGLPVGAVVVDRPDNQEAALEAARLVAAGEASFLMKGAINTSDFLRAVLDPKSGLRTGRILSHLAAFEVPGESKLIFHSDGGMNVAPELEEKAQIIKNAVEALHALGVGEPKVAILAANEQVNPKVRATTDAQALVSRWKAGEFPGCLVEGPIALDVATSREAAAHKGIESAIAGEPDLLIMPSIEAGNIAGKTLVRYAKAKMAGVVLGAACPIVLVSRGDDAAAKVRSLALACLVFGRGAPSPGSTDASAREAAG